MVCQPLHGRLDLAGIVTRQDPDKVSVVTLGQPKRVP